MSDQIENVDNEFRACVLGFIQATEDADAVEVTAVGGYGTDWAGDTDGGFYSTFDASVRWRSADGTVKNQSYVGESMGELWKWVVKGRSEIASR